MNKKKNYLQKKWKRKFVINSSLLLAMQWNIMHKYLDNIKKNLMVFLIVKKV